MKIFGVTKMEKYLVVFNYHDNGDIILYDGIEKLIVPYKDWDEDRRHYISSEFKYIKCEDKKTEEQTYNDYVRDAHTLKRETDGLINLYKTGSIPQTSLALFNHFNEVVPEKITAEESVWLNATTVGAIVWCRPYEGEIWKYDIVSMYPSIMQDNHMLFPIKQGKFETLEKFDIDYHTAIYRCQIEGESKLFRFNPTCYYTSHDVRRARELKLKITLIQETECIIL